MAVDYSIVTYKDSIQVISVPESPTQYNIVTSASKETSISSVRQSSEGVIFYRPQIAVILEGMVGGKSRFLNPEMVMAIIYNESAFNSRERNDNPARGLGQFIYETGLYWKIVDPYNYADHLPGIVAFINDNFKHYEKTLSNRDEIMSCGVMSHLTGKGKTLAQLRNSNLHDREGSTPYSYASKIAKTYVSLGGESFTVVR